MQIETILKKENKSTKDLEQIIESLQKQIKLRSKLIMEFEVCIALLILP